MAQSALTPTTWKIRRSPTKKNVAEFIKVYNRIQRELFLNKEWLASSPTKKNSKMEEAAAQRELFLNEGEDTSLMVVSMHEKGKGDDEDEDDAASYSISNLFELDFTRSTNLVSEKDEDVDDEHEDDPVLEFDLMGNSWWKHHMMGCKAVNLLKK